MSLELLSCDICSGQFLNKVDLEKHLCIDLKPKEHTCVICNKVFPERWILNDHLQVHILNTFSVSGIDKIPFTENNLAENDSPVKDQLFECNLCEKQYRYKSDLKRHQQDHYGLKPFTCDICKKSFSRKNALNRHLTTHTGEKPFECDFCGFTSNRKYILTSHLQVVHNHSIVDPYLCHICGKHFNKFSFRLHIKLHVKNKAYFCVTCNKDYQNKQKLIEHLEIESAINVFSCDKCEQRFTHKYTLNEHKRIHKRKPHACKVCKSQFAAKHLLSEHLKTHLKKRKKIVSKKTPCKKRKASKKYQNNRTERQLESGMCNQETVLQMYLEAK